MSEKADFACIIALELNPFSSFTRDEVSSRAGRERSRPTHRSSSHDFISE
jgi:hypothetical protein